VKITFLGTGTSHGVPIAFCGCKTCTSPDPRNKRNRSSALVETADSSVLIDVPAEFRLSALKHSIKRIGAILLTHAHADHTAGLDDIRVYNELQDGAIKLYADAATVAEIKQRFHYIFEKTQEGGGKPKLELIVVKPGEKFTADGLEVMPFMVKHGELDILGFRLGDFSYITDVSEIPAEAFGAVKGSKTLVLDALRPEPHPTHFNIFEAVEAAEKIAAGRTFFTHISHRLEHEETELELPRDIRLAYDGLEIEIKP
jgi:phosphoribosyl 1,2-cyclic phosphate phosphodiesterase